MTAEGGETAAKFEASRAWLMRFQERKHLYMQGEAASADDVKASLSYPEDLTKIVNEGSYTKQEAFDVDKTALYWKETPSTTLVASEEKSMPGFKASETSEAAFLLRGQCSW